MMHMCTQTSTEWAKGDKEKLLLLLVIQIQYLQKITTH